MRIVNGLIAGVLMWTSLGLFQRYRDVILVSTNDGGNNKDGQWTFGQVLALATWLPVAVDLASIIICEFPSAIESLQHF